MKTKRLPFFVFIGSALEYFDYLLFPLLATVLMKFFFPFSENTAILNFIFFSLGAVAKLFGGVFFGFIADKFGRKFVIQMLSLTMAIATTAIGALPIGLSEYFYITTFFILRILQALSFGGEMPSASTYAYEMDVTKNTKMISCVFIGATLGAILATAFLSLLNNTTNQNQFHEWGWRIPFIFGGLVGAISFIYRKNLRDTHVVKNTLKTHDIFQILISNKTNILLSSAVLLFPISLTSLNIYFPLYFSKYLLCNIENVYSAQLISLISSCIFLYLAGILVDKFNFSANKIFLIITILFILTSPFFTFIANYSLYIFMIFWQFFIAFTIIYGMKQMLTLLPQLCRGTVSGFVYNFNFLLVSSIPIVFSQIHTNEISPSVLFYFPIGIAFFSIIAMFIKSSKTAIFYLRS